MVEILRGSRWSLSVASEFARSSGSPLLVGLALPPRSSSVSVRWLSAEEVRRVVQAVRGDPLLEFVAFLGLGQGLRRVEWQRLRIDDVDLPGERLLVRGKGRAEPKLVWIPLHPDFPPIYARFLAFRDQLVRVARRRTPTRRVPPEALIHDGPTGLRNYAIGGLDRLVGRIERKLGASGPPLHLSSHMFRRSAATALEESLLGTPGASVDGVYRILQGFLRHENLATTMRYLEANPRRQRRALDRFARAVPW